MYTSPKLQMRRATLQYWPAGALECIVQPVPNVPYKITVVPSKHTSLKLQLRRATWHYWPSHHVVLYLPEYPCRIWGSRQGAYTYDLILFFTCLSTPAKTGALGKGLIISYNPILLLRTCSSTPATKWGSRHCGLTHMILS